MAVAEFTLLGSPFFTNIVMPFILLFTVTFAILEKTSVLGDKRKDINAIVALIFALVSVGVPAAVGVITSLIPVISVMLIILFSWFLIFGFIGDFKTKWPEGLKKTFLVVIGVIILTAVTWSTGLFDKFSLLDAAVSSRLMQMMLLVGVVIAIIAIVVGGSTAKKEGVSDEELGA